ncbi:MAG TPA: membrane protein insertase YidC [Chryseosolibacter sp.]|nr:membrane protein insertase YidC [Chryseosolibacter sp.]
MDRNSAIGLTLIAALLLVYFYWFAPAPSPEQVKPQQTFQQPEEPQESGNQETVATSDSLLNLSYGDLSAYAKGDINQTPIETEDLRIIFSNKGGIITDLELKNYKTYSKEPLKLITPATNKFALNVTYKGKDIDLYSLYYKLNKRNEGDTIFLDYAINLEGGASLVQSYAIPKKGFGIKYRLKQTGLAESINGETLAFNWNNIIRPTEKDLQETRIHTTVTYYATESGFDELSERSTSTETETLENSTQWVTVKQNFFLSSIIAENTTFAGGEVRTDINPPDSSVVKQASVKVLIPKTALTNGAKLKYYFGPNDYQEIGDVAMDFKKNVYLGWPPVYWINKFIIFPVFHFLTKHIANYGLIIIILVLLLKLVLFPLSYKSYLSMAKMKVLKPDLDVIKEKHGDDMAKIQQEQLKLYQQVGVNPISGCIPVLLQMPILFAMFYLFPASIELRQQPFLWAEDLSTYDSIIRFSFTIPFMGSHISLFTLLMTISTLVYTWQNNQMSSVTGPMKVMSYMMPIIFFFVLNSFSAGLTFYYFVSNLVTFAQQAIIKRFVDENKIKVLLEENRKKIATGTGKKSKFMSKLEEAMKASEEARKRTDEDRKKKKR